MTPGERMTLKLARPGARPGSVPSLSEKTMSTRDEIPPGHMRCAGCGLLWRVSSTELEEPAADGRMHCSEFGRVLKDWSGTRRTYIFEMPDPPQKPKEH